jgi:hypothetical protein
MPVESMSQVLHEMGRPPRRDGVYEDVTEGIVHGDIQPTAQVYNDAAVIEDSLPHKLTPPGPQDAPRRGGTPDSDRCPGSPSHPSHNRAAKQLRQMAGCNHDGRSVLRGCLWRHVTS